MGLADLVSWTLDLVRTDSAVEVDEARVRRLASRARSDTVTTDVLDGSSDLARHPLVGYLDDGEQPEYVFRGSRLLISDGESMTRRHPARQLPVVVSDRRVLFVVGNRLADDALAIPLEDVELAYLDDEEMRRYLVVEGRRDGDEMTFFAEVTGEPDEASLRDAVSFIDRGGDDP